ncbi:MAG: hypothetical protein J1F11_11110, partial [Oscillospiraceae bacterium]|nr:hypothetical protein [Oscillospiraceae bacterium]
NINEIDPVRYMHETDLEFLFRKKKSAVDIYCTMRIFIDLDGDDFPERVQIIDENIYLSKFEISSGKWKQFVNDVPIDTDIHLFHDRENDCYFYIYHKYLYEYDYIHKINITENEFIDGTIGRYNSTSDHQIAINPKYISDKKIDFGYFNGTFFIEENAPDIAVYEMNEKMPHCELISTINIQEIIDKYSNDHNGNTIYDILISSFSDSPQPSEYKKPLPENNESETGTYSTSLSGVWIDEEHFEQLSHLPDLIYLHLIDFYVDDDDTSVGRGNHNSHEYVESTIDLNGISKLSGLKCLEIETDNIINTSEIGKLNDLRMLIMEGDPDDISFLTDMDSLEAIEFTDLSDKPADFLAPLYGMKNLKYLIISRRTLITDEQIAHISENAPWINIV